MSENLETIKAKYKLSEEEHNQISEKIKQIMLYDKFPVKQPKAIINIAPPASGKTGLNGYAAQQFPNNNVVIINSDELKPFHPHVDEIAKLYPQYYTKVTDQESNTWTSDLFDTVLQQKYNVIFEGTGRNARILDTIKDKMQDYDVSVRGMAVNELNCLISILERYEYQVATRGWGRLVTPEHFYETYTAMPTTLETIEQSGLVNSIEVYTRGVIPSQPKCLYNSNIREFPSCKYAIFNGRKLDELNANKHFTEKINTLLELINTKKLTSEEQIILHRIHELHDTFEKKKTCCKIK